MKSDKWLQDIINNPNKINKALIKNREGNLRTFWVKVQKVPYEKTHYYLFTLIDLTALFNNLPLENNTKNENIKEEKVEENKVENIDLFSKIKDELKLPDEIIINLVDKFISSSEDSLIKIRNAIKNNQVEQFKIIIHNIKGSAATLRFNEISSIASFIEENFNENKLENNLKEIEKIEQHITNIKNYRENR